MVVPHLGRKKRKTQKVKSLFHLHSNVMALMQVPSSRLELTSHWPEVNHTSLGLYVFCVCVYIYNLHTISYMYIKCTIHYSFITIIKKPGIVRR